MKMIIWISVILALLAVTAYYYLAILPARGQICTRTLRAASLLNNCMGESPLRKMSIYLPPGYHQSQQRYPCIYFLHGFLAGHEPDASLHLRKLFDQAIAEKVIPPFIMVFPNSQTRFGGSYYTNSPFAGKWADYISLDVVHYVDSNFRTIASRDSRGIAGHSMGANGALKLAMRYPDVFSSVYALTPGILNWAGELVPEHPSFKIIYHAKGMKDIQKDAYAMGFLAMASTYTADPGNPPFFCRVPVSYPNGVLTIDSGIMRQWEAEFPVHLAVKHADDLKKLKGIGMDWGIDDDREHIVPTCREFSALLKKLGIPHEAEEFKGGHSDRLGGKNGRIYSAMLPFFSKHLQP